MKGAIQALKTVKKRWGQPLRSKNKPKTIPNSETIACNNIQIVQELQVASNATPKPQGHKHLIDKKSQPTIFQQFKMPSHPSQKQSREADCQDLWPVGIWYKFQYLIVSILLLILYTNNLDPWFGYIDISWMLCFEWIPEPWHNRDVAFVLVFF